MGAFMDDVIKIPDGFFSSLNASPEDKIKIEYSNGFLEITIKKPNGIITTHKYYGENGFDKMKCFNSDTIDKETKKKLAIALHKNSGLSQTEIAAKLEIAQSTVSNYIKGNN